MPHKTFVEVDVEVHAQHEAAVLVSTDGDEDSAGWVPYSTISGHSSVNEFSNVGSCEVLICEEWVALEKGLI